MSSSSISPPLSRYRPQLDGLRALAVLAVLVHHFLPVSLLIPNDFLTLGMLAVRMFFVLSGYLITLGLLAGKARPVRETLRAFYYRRALRIFPAYYAAVLVLLVLGHSGVRNDAGWFLTHTTNLLFTYGTANPGSVGHFWTLAVEEQFYLLWPLAVLLTPWRHMRALVLGCIGLSLAWKLAVALAAGPHLALALPMPACMDSLGLGALLALAEWNGRRERLLRTCTVAGTAIVAAQFAIYLSGHGLWLFWGTSHFGVSLLFVTLIARAGDGITGWAGAVLAAKPLRYLGKISYGMYVYHNFMPDAVRWMFDRAGWGEPRFIVLVPLATAATIALSALSWHLMEAPVLRLKNVSLRARKAPRPTEVAMVPPAAP